MIEEANTLETIAEISAAIAGFAALAGVLVNEDRRPHLPSDDTNEDSAESPSNGTGYARLRIVVISSLFFIIAALLPVVLQHLPAASGRLWQICAAITFIANSVILIEGIRHAKRRNLPLDDRSASFLVWPLEVVCQLSLLIVIFGAFPTSAGALYLLFLIAGLTQTAVIFVELLDEILSE